MATTYTFQNFTPAVIPGVLKSDQRSLIITAVGMGWSFMVKSDNNCTLRAPAPNEGQTIHVSGRRKSGPIVQLLKKVEKYGNPLLVPNLEDDKSIDHFITQTEHAVKTAPERAPAPVSTPVEPDMDHGPTRKEVEAQKVRKKRRKIILRQPMISKGGSLGGYSSNIAVERHYDDGSINYKCVRCDFVGESPRSMASHWGKHVREDERNRGGHRGVDVPLEREAYQPTEERLNSLADSLENLLKVGIDWSDPTAAARQLAYRALLWENDRRHRGESGLREPLSDTELLNKIRAMVDNGLYDALREEIADLKATVEVQEARVLAAEEEHQKTREKMLALRDLFNEEAV